MVSSAKPRVNRYRIFVGFLLPVVILTFFRYSLEWREVNRVVADVSNKLTVDVSHPLRASIGVDGVDISSGEEGKEEQALHARSSSAIKSSTTNEKTPSKPLFVEPRDSVYLRTTLWGWDNAPIVVEKYKLVFFTQAKVGCTVWKQLFRRMAGYADWAKVSLKTRIPWNPETNGLTYLYDYKRTVASRMMTSPEWTRAIFVREPKERFVSAYLNKALGLPNYINRRCCPRKPTCQDEARKSLEAFFRIAKVCDDPHWRHQASRMPAKYWKQINFVGHMEDVAQDAQRLLRRIGAWEMYGSTGWGEFGNETIFSPSVKTFHATDARSKLKQYVTSATMEQIIEQYYEVDYKHPVLNITPIHLYDN